MEANYMENSGAGQFPEFSWTSGRIPDLITLKGPEFRNRKKKKRGSCLCLRTIPGEQIRREMSAEGRCLGPGGQFLWAPQHPEQLILCHSHPLAFCSKFSSSRNTFSRYLYRNTFSSDTTKTRWLGRTQIPTTATGLEDITDTLYLPHLWLILNSLSARTSSILGDLYT